MKLSWMLLAAGLSLAATPGLADGGLDDLGNSVTNVQRDLSALEKRVEQQERDLLRRIEAAEARAGEVSSRLGEGFGRTTVFNTIERRLTNLEKRLDEIERTLARLESRLKRVESGK